MQLLKKYFPELTDEQLTKFEKHKELFIDWNSKINMVSRKDMDNLEERHVLHALAIAKVVKFLPGTKVLDVGTGGGFPGIPLAIMFPETRFFLIDSIGKKINVVKDLAIKLDLKNVEAGKVRAEDFKTKVDFVVSRAVTRLNKFLPWIASNITDDFKHETMNGILYLKGGDLTEEMEELDLFCNEYEISNYFDEEFFETKKVIHIPKQW